MAMWQASYFRSDREREGNASKTGQWSQHALALPWGVWSAARIWSLTQKSVVEWVGGIRAQCTGLGSNTIPRLSEFLRQVQAEVVSNSRNKIHKTWGWKFSPPL